MRQLTGRVKGVESQMNELKKLVREVLRRLPDKESIAASASGIEEETPSKIHVMPPFISRKRKFEADT